MNRPDKKPAVSVVIPNYNGLKFLKIVLPSLAKQTHRNFEVIVVDDASDDGSVAYMRKHHPKVRVIVQPENGGFAVTCNQGLTAARGEFVALINNDLELDRRWIAEMERALREHPKAGSTACKMMQYKARKTFDEAGGIGNWYGLFVPRGNGRKDTGQYDTVEPVLYGSGGAVLYRRTALKQVGLLDEKLIAYLEDVDLGLRLQLAGWACIYVPSAVVYHIGGATYGTQKISTFRQYQWARNTRIVIVKDYPLGALVRYFPKLVYGEAKMFLGAVKEGWFGVYAKSWLGFWARLPHALAERFRIQRRRTVDLRYLDTVISRRFALDSGLFHAERPEAS